MFILAAAGLLFSAGTGSVITLVLWLYAYTPMWWTTNVDQKPPRMPWEEE